MYYYQINVIQGRSGGYSIGLKSETKLDGGQVVEEAVKQELFPNKGDEELVDDVETITAEEFKIYE